MICSMCFTAFAECDSIGSDQGLCQDCWEAACSAEWWESLAAMHSDWPIESQDSAEA